MGVDLEIRDAYISAEGVGLHYRNSFLVYINHRLMRRASALMELEHWENFTNNLWLFTLVQYLIIIGLDELD